MHSIHGMHVVNTDAISYQSKTPEKCLDTTEHENKRNYPNTCLNEHRKLTPFVESVVGLLSVKAEATLKRIARCLAQNWKEPYSHTCRYVKGGSEITLVWATHRCTRGARVPASSISVTLTQWEDGSGLYLFR